MESVGVEFEVDEDDTVLRGAFRQGQMLMHGYKEGQCAACGLRNKLPDRGLTFVDSAHLHPFSARHKPSKAFGKHCPP